MATPAQITANRLNAQRSTGPRSEDGKASTRFNALKHGMDAHSLVIPGEDPAEFDALALDYREQFHPAGALENYLVEALIQADWTRRRLTRLQTELLRAFLKAREEIAPQSSTSPLAFVFTDDAMGPNLLDKVHRQLAFSERGYFHALSELRRAQHDRQAEADVHHESGAGLLVCSPPSRAAKPAVSVLQPAALAPAEIGFVSPIPSPAAPRLAVQAAAAAQPGAPR